MITDTKVKDVKPGDVISTDGLVVKSNVYDPHAKVYCVSGTAHGTFKQATFDVLATLPVWTPDHA